MYASTCDYTQDKVEWFVLTHETLGIGLAMSRAPNEHIEKLQICISHRSFSKGESMAKLRLLV